MKTKLFIAIILSAAFVLTLGVTSAQANLLANPSFESPDASGGDVSGPPTGWSGFNFNATTAVVTALDGTQTLKQFGPFNPFFDASGVLQSFPVVPGEIVTLSANGRNDSSDPISGGGVGDPGNFAVVKLEWFDGGGSPIGTPVETLVVDKSSPADVWLPGTVVGVAPAGAASVNTLLLHVSDGTFLGGSVFWDDASVTITPEPASLSLLGLGGALLLRRRR